jgi:hypothetical protein
MATIVAAIWVTHAWRVFQIVYHRLRRGLDDLFRHTLTVTLFITIVVPVEILTNKFGRR